MKYVKIFLKVFLGVVLLVSAMSAFAADQGIALSSIRKNFDTTVTFIASVLSDISLIAGIGFVLASFFKFHQHKLNPTQVPISQGLTLLLVGAGLILFPTLLPTTAKAIFGSSVSVAKVGGSEITSLIGGSSGG